MPSWLDGDTTSYARSCAPVPVVLSQGPVRSWFNVGRTGTYVLSGVVTSATGADLTNASLTV